MRGQDASRFVLALSGGGTVSAVLMHPPQALGCFVFAHGAVADMEHAFMQDMAERLSRVGIASLRYQFPYMEKRAKRPDRPAVAHEAVRAAVTWAGEAMPNRPLIAGGKSFGGRMTSQAQAATPLPGVVGLAFLGFPWHPAHEPSTKRGEHLKSIKIPMLFLQGARDSLADAKVVESQIRQLGPLATLHIEAHADHGFHVGVRSGRTDSEVQGELVIAFRRWFDAIDARRYVAAPRDTSDRASATTGRALRSIRAAPAAVWCRPSNFDA